jgi:hypothetical protein
MKNDKQGMDVESFIIWLTGADKLYIYPKRQSVSNGHSIHNDNVICSIETLGQNK